MVTQGESVKSSVAMQKTEEGMNLCLVYRCLLLSLSLMEDIEGGPEWE